MNRKQLTLLLLVVFWAAVLGMPGIWLCQAERQEQLNRQLIAAIKRGNTAAALRALTLGADAKSRDEPRLSEWTRLWNLLRRQQSPTSTAPTALLLALDHYDRKREPDDNPKLIGALLSRGADV